MIKLNKLLKLNLLLILMISSVYIVFAEVKDEGVILRPVVEYSSGDLRDPFSNLFQLGRIKREQNIQVPQEGIEQIKVLPDLKKFKVQGVIWGGKFPQAIINNKIFKVGDLVEGFEIMNIEKKGISLGFGVEMFILPTPGNAPATDKEDKEVNKADEAKEDK